MRKILLGMVAALIASSTMSAQLFSENFDAGVPDGYTLENQWKHGVDADHASQYFAPVGTGSYLCVNDDALGDGVDGNGRAITSSIDLTSATGGLILSFDAYFVNGDYGDADETGKVYVSEDGGTTFSEVRDVPATTPFGKIGVDLSDYAGKNIILAFEYQDGGGWNYGFCIDNIEIVQVSGPSLNAVYAEAFCQVTKVGNESALRMMIENDGLEEITSLDVVVSDGTNEYVTNLTDLSIPSFARQEIQVNPIVASEGVVTYTLSLISPNGVEDFDPATPLQVVLAGITPVEGSRILVEEATGTWCTWCPRGTFYLDRYSKCLEDNFVGIAVHSGDPMENEEYNEGVGMFPSFEGYPSVIVDKSELMDPQQIGNPTIAKITQEAIALVRSGSEYDESTRMLTVSIEGSGFTTDMEGVKFFAALVEDGVSGSGEGWDQVNNYAGGALGPMGGFELLPSPAPNQVYDHVGRALLGGFYGEGATDVAVGETITHTFAPIEVSSDFNYDNMKVVALLLDSDNKVINASQVTTEEAEAVGLFVSSTDEIVDPNLAQIFPNPANDQFTVSVDLQVSAQVLVEIFDFTGKKVYSQDYGDRLGKEAFIINTMDYNTGLYSVNVKAGNRVLTTKVSIVK